MPLRRQRGGFACDRGDLSLATLSRRALPDSVRPASHGSHVTAEATGGMQRGWGEAATGTGRGGRSPSASR